MTETQTALEKELESGFNTLKTMAPDHSKYGEAVDNVAKLYRLHLEEEKLEAEREEKANRLEYERWKSEEEARIKNEQIDADAIYHEAELRLRDEQFLAQLAEQKSSQRKERIIKIALAVVGLAAPLIFEGVWLGRGFKFEETGVFTTTTLRNFMSKRRRKTTI